MTRAGWTRVASLVLLAGGIAWLLKLIAIPTTGGEDFESPVVALFYFLGIFGMLIGSTGIASHFAQGARLPLYVIALVLSPVVIWFLFMSLDEGLKPLGEAGPEWYEAEGGITVMAVLMLAVGTWLWGRTGSAPST